MAEQTHSPPTNGLVRIEPDRRIVVLARTMQSEQQDIAADGAADEDARLGRALYRHASVFQGASRAPPWSHLELTYFGDVVPSAVIRDLVFGGPPDGVRLLRAEILLTTPSSFVMPSHWRGGTGRPGRRASLEYIDVRPAALGAYRDIMQRHIGPAAARLVAMDRIGTFRAMETAAVLHRDPSFDVDWNQIHLCEVDDDFRGFEQEFDAALREVAPDGGFAGVFAGLGGIRSIPRWTFNEAVEATGAAVGPSGSDLPPLG